MISGISKHLIFAKGCNHLRSGQDAAIKCGQKHVLFFKQKQPTHIKKLFEKTRDGSRSDQPFRGLQPSSARKASSNHGLKVQISCYYNLLYPVNGKSPPVTESNKFPSVLIPGILQSDFGCFCF
jgi:hypothetical protein